MRAFGRINRRSFLARALAFCTAFVQSGWLSSGTARAEPDYFTGTDFIGKTRAGKFKQFYINYWKPFRRIKSEDWALNIGGLCETPRTFSLDQLKALSSIHPNLTAEMRRVLVRKGTMDRVSFF